MARFYKLDVQPTLFGECSLVRVWGRIGRAGTVRVELQPESDGWLVPLLAIETTKARRFLRAARTGAVENRVSFSLRLTHASAVVDCPQVLHEGVGVLRCPDFRRTHHLGVGNTGFDGKRRVLDRGPTLACAGRGEDSGAPKPAYELLMH
ncbi:WGR domain-containing protein [Bradyrhizobium sp. CCBAU 11445]